jgi:hypothetical protein
MNSTFKFSDPILTRTPEIVKILMGKVTIRTGICQGFYFKKYILAVARRLTQRVSFCVAARIFQIAESDQRQNSQPIFYIENFLKFIYFQLVFSRHSQLITVVPQQET